MNKPGSKWVIKKDGQQMAYGSMATMPPDDLVRSMSQAGYKTYIDGKLYKPQKETKAGRG